MLSSADYVPFSHINGGKVKLYFTLERKTAVQSIVPLHSYFKGVVLVSMYIFYLFDCFLFSLLEKREKIWHWDKAGFRFVNCEITI